MAANPKKLFTIPNIISMARVAMIPLFSWAFFTGKEILALVVVIVSGVSDRLDGVIARKYDMISETGKWLDPMADKFTQIALALIMFLRFYNSADSLMRFTGWVFLGFIGKEVVMLLFALTMLLTHKRPAAAEVWGKAATTAFYIVMGLLLFAGPDVGILARYFDGLCMWPWLATALVAITLVLMVIAFLSYIPDTYRKFFVEGKEEKK